MPHSSHVDQLREAVQKERSEESLRRDRCDSFLEKIILFQKGRGPLPDEQEFLLWREDLKRAAVVQALESGLLPADHSDRGGTIPGEQVRAKVARQRLNGQADPSNL